jgi:uncharacterized protein
LIRFVLDANVLLAALAGGPNAPPALLLASVHNGEVEAVGCPLLINEVREGLQKPYFRAQLNALEAMEAVEAYVELCVMYDGPAKVDAALRDPDDDYLVALAQIAGAHAIVTGDRDLLDHDGLVPPAINARAAYELAHSTESVPGSAATIEHDERHEAEEHDKE